jgi:hypothetical protein
LDPWARAARLFDLVTRFLEPISEICCPAKKIFQSVPEGERMDDFEGLFDKLRHRQSDKFRRADRMCGTDFLEGITDHPGSLTS